MSTPDHIPKICPVCQGTEAFKEKVPFRIKGLAGTLASLGDTQEALMKLSMYRCPKCGHVDLYYI